MSAVRPSPSFCLALSLDSHTSEGPAAESSAESVLEILIDTDLAQEKIGSPDFDPQKKDARSLAYYPPGLQRRKFALRRFSDS